MGQDDEPTVTVKLSDYDKLRELLRVADNTNLALKLELQVAQHADPSNTIKTLLDGFYAAIKIVQFAVANNAPESIIGWPHVALVEVADAIDKTPSIDRHIAEVTAELREFAKTAAGLEAYRKERDKLRVILPATSADFGPKTPEAAAAHAARAQQLGSISPTAPNGASHTLASVTGEIGDKNKSQRTPGFYLVLIFLLAGIGGFVMLMMR